MKNKRLPHSKSLRHLKPTTIIFFSVIADSISADIKLETENEEGICSEDAPTCLSSNVYHPRVALKNAINEWLPEFYVTKEAWGPITKPHPIQTSELTTFIINSERKFHSQIAWLGVKASFESETKRNIFYNTPTTLDQKCI